jgi:hypothetical protein
MPSFPRLASSMKLLLRFLGLLPLIRWLRYELPPAIRFWRFRSRYGKVLQRRLPLPSPPRSALLVSGPHTCISVDLWMIRALETAGFRVAVLALEAKHWDRYYRLAGASSVHAWSEFTAPEDPLVQAQAVVDRSRSLQDLVRFEYADTRVGRIACSTALRELRTGALDLSSSPLRRQHVARLLARSMALADASRALLRQIAPERAVFYDMVYTRRAELFELCLLDRIPTAIWHPAHRNNALILKLYGMANRDEHPVSLSPESWLRIKDMPWSEAHRTRLHGELSRAYSLGDWYGESGTQFSKRLVGRAEVQRQLGLDPRKKSAFIFAHIAWDAPLSWGKNLFENYEQWLIETVRAACRNDAVNWVVKIHPANIGKQLKERYQGEPAELTALRKHVPRLPPHVFLLHAESDFSTYSLFDLMDYCLTVRGTIGIEAASFGIPVLTAGTGRYDRRGFTVDSASREQYLDRIGRIQDIPPLAPQARELAERFAYAIFLLRPFPLESIRLEYDSSCSPSDNFTRSRINAASAEEWGSARDVARLADWLANPGDADFLMPVRTMPEAVN